MDLINNIRIVATELVFQTTSSQYTYLHLHVWHVRLSYSRMCCMHNIRVIHTHFYILYNVFLLSTTRSTTTSCQYKLVCKYYSREQCIHSAYYGYYARSNRYQLVVAHKCNCRSTELDSGCLPRCNFINNYLWPKDPPIIDQKADKPHLLPLGRPSQRDALRKGVIQKSIN